MLPRLLEQIAFSPKFGRQMRFIAGPRQTGKTTLAKLILQKNACDPALYYNWDQRKLRQRYKENPYFFVSDHPPVKGKKPWLCFDEIHKMPKWKNMLKDFFDTYEDQYRFIVTGSARLDFFKKSGDSLAGRYFLFKLLPLSLLELTASVKSKISPPPQMAREFIEKQLSNSLYHQSLFEQLLHFSGFPEPFQNGTNEFHERWQEDYQDRLVREDLRDLTKIHDLENVATLMQLLPGKVGNPLSLQALTHDVEVSHTAIKNYVKALKLCYIIFTISPYSKKIQRAVKKETKCYFFDWTKIQEPAARFENYLAVELFSLINLWNDAGWGHFELSFLRMRDKKETDFLILRDSKPWMLIEAKQSSTNIDSHHFLHARQLGNIPFVQLTQKNNVCLVLSPTAYVISASRFFGFVG